MREYAVTVSGIDCRVTIEPAMQGARASGIAFDDDGNIAADERSTQYVDYCHGEIVHIIVRRLLLGIVRPRFIESALECADIGLFTIRGVGVV